MNKTAKISLVAGAIVLTACVGVTALVGCKDNTPVDHYANMSVSDFYTISDYMSSSQMLFPNLVVTYDNTNGSLHKRYTLKYNKLNSDEVAYFNVDAVLQSDEGLVNLRGQAWLKDKKLYIDNGSEQYYVSYDKNRYRSTPDSKDGELDESALFNKYLSIAIENISIPTNTEFLNSFEADNLWKHCKFYSSVENDDHYFKISYYENEDTLTDDTLKSVAKDYKLQFNNLKAVSYEQYTTTVKGKNTLTELLRYENSADNLTMPGNLKDWKLKNN